MSVFVQLTGSDGFQPLDVDPELDHRWFEYGQRTCSAKLKAALGITLPAKRTVLDAFSAASGTDLSALKTFYSYYPMDDEDDPLFEEYGEPYDEKVAAEHWFRATLAPEQLLAAIEKVLSFSEAHFRLAFKEDAADVRSDLKALQTALEAAKGATAVVMCLDPGDL